MSDIIGPMGSSAPYKGRYKNARLLVRMIRMGWLPPDDRLEEVRQSLEDVAIHSLDDRAKVAAARVLLDAEIEATRQAAENVIDITADTIETEEPTEPEPDPAPTYRLPSAGNTGT